MTARQRLENDFQALNDSGILSNRHECFKTPLVKFIGNNIRDPSDVFSVSSLMKILMTSFPAFYGCLCKQWGCLGNEKNITRCSKHYFIHPLRSFVKCFYHLKIEYIFSCYHVISSIYTITKSMRAPWLVNQLWFIVPVNPWKNRASTELLYKSNRPQVSMVYRLINHLGCW